MKTVSTNYGIVEGDILDSGVAVFKGVPYAEPPVGNLRWRRPIPPHKWEGVRPAKEFSLIYPQTDDWPFYVKEFGRPSDMPSGEDCLYMNIWTKAQSSSEKLPVLFFIHGGGYDHGYGHRTPIDGENFALKGNVFVSFNYRIGVFGFLSHPLLESDENMVYEVEEDEFSDNDEDNQNNKQNHNKNNSNKKEDASYSDNHQIQNLNHSKHDLIEKSGNYGLYDQLAALQWVHENISYFGGDPSNIILIGQSAGAMSIQIMYESRLTRGLFSKVIMMSGGGYITKIPILKSLGCRTKKEVQRTSAKILLRTLKCKTLAEARRLTTEELYEAYNNSVYPFTLTPFADGEIYTTTHKEWENYMRNLCRIEKERMTNSCRPGEENVDLSELDYYRNIPMIIGCLKNEFGYETKVYFYRCTINLCNFLSGSIFANINGNNQSSNNNNNTNNDNNNTNNNIRGPFLYFGKYSMPGDDKRGAFHSSDLWFVFGMCKKCWRRMGEKEERLSNLFSTYWSNFAHTGNPNGNGLPTWHPFTPESQMQLGISDEIISMEKKHMF